MFAKWRRFLVGKNLVAGATFAVGFLVLGLLVAHCLARPLNRDEEQFVASAALLSREGLLPYVDYPYFHFPNLVFIFAGLFRTNDHLLLTARSFNVVCAVALLALIFSVSARIFKFRGRKRWLIAAAATLALCFNPFFQFTAGRAWNHDLPTLASVLALLALTSSRDGRRGPLAIAASGILLGLAVGTRLTFLPLILPFFVLVWFRRSSLASKPLRIVLFVAAFSLAMLPTIALFARAPAAFVFDNLTCNGAVNLRYRQSTVPGEITSTHKLLFPIEQVAKSVSTLALMLVFFYAGVRIWRSGGWREMVSSDYGACLLLLPFLFLGGWLPTPSYRQYYYEVIPFLLLATLFSLASLEKRTNRFRSLLFLAPLATLAILEFIPDLFQTRSLTSPAQWPVFALHQKGLALRKIVGAGSVLTLMPIFPLEGRARIYKEFATGPFAWRISPFIPESARARFDLINADDLAQFLQTSPPSAILTGGEEPSLEKPLVEYAKSRDYRSESLVNRKLIWRRSP